MRPNKEFSGLPGGNSEREPPDPIPNSEVKTPCADGSGPASHARVGHCQAPHARRPQYESIGAFSLVRPAGRTHLEVEVLYSNRTVWAGSAPAVTWTPSVRVKRARVYVSAWSTNGRIHCCGTGSYGYVGS